MSYANAQLAIEQRLANALVDIALLVVDGGDVSSADSGQVVDGGSPASSASAVVLDGNAVLLVQWPNGPTIQPDGIAYAEVFHMPARTFVDTLGTTGQDLVPGVTQVDVYNPLATGNNMAAGVVDTFRASFKAGTWLTVSGQAVLVISCGPGPAHREGSYFKSIVTIEWEARIAR